ncbi:MAG: class I SAM-dependent methyltransferase [Zoogloeaceae bacterium]|jgi:SAM-dependent methyltransferase|nr:class I SAM-dependent methyltransferase [Zoogloeaceae bacterium]
MDSHCKRECVPTVDDELEQLILREIALRKRHGDTPRVLDLHCEEGRRASAMAVLGAQVLAVDTADRQASVLERAKKENVSDAVEFRALNEDKKETRLGCLKNELFEFVFCHHGIHRLPYAEAKETLRQILKTLHIGGKLYISAYGLHSALAEGYADTDKRVEERFSPLTTALAKNYGLRGSVCLYTERNLVNLLFEAGSSVLRSFTTTHGTVKAVAVRI